MAEKWKKGLRSVGGETAGQIVQITEGIFHNYQVGDNADAFYIDYDDEPFSDYPIEIETRNSQETNKLLAKFEIKSGGVVTGYLGIRYSYVKGVNAQSRLYLTVSAEVGIMDENDNFTMQNATGDCSLSIGGTSFYTFRATIHLCVGSQNGRTVFGLAVQNHEYAISNDYEARCVLTSRNYVQGLIKPEKSFSPEFGPASDWEGYEPTGGFDDSSDTIGMPSLPQSVLSLGFVNVYKCDAGSLTQFGGELFPDIQWPSTLDQVGEVLAAVSDSIWNSKLIDYVISVHCVPGNVTGGNLTDIKVGTRTMTGIMGRPITSEYVDYDFGTVTLDKYYKNYADYMTEIQLFLPMYGFISIRPEEVIDGEINVKYRFNVIDGSFMAYVFSTSSRSKLKDSLIGQYGGSCIVHLPVSNLSYASMFSSMIGAGAAGAIAAMGVGGATATAAAVGLTAAPGIVNAAQGGDVKKSNSYNASSSFMSRMKPYMIVTRPVSSFSTMYNVESGLPSNIAMTLGECSGFTQADNAILDGIPCTLAEKQRIRQYLREGVIIK